MSEHDEEHRPEALGDKGLPHYQEQQLADEEMKRMLRKNEAEEARKPREEREARVVNDGG